MARIRTLKPEILSDERTAALSDGAFRLFVGFITLSDDYGTARASVPWLSGQIWWACGDSPRVAEFLRELSASGLVTVYRVRNQAYCHLNGWAKHQRIDNAGKPQVPGPEEGDDGSTDTAAEIRGEPPTVAAGSGKGIGPGEGGEGALAAPPSTAAPKPVRKTPAHPLPADWVPNDQHRDIARSENRDVTREAARFRDWAASNGEVKADWDATFRNWLRNGFGNASPKGSGVSAGAAAPQRRLERL